MLASIDTYNWVHGTRDSICAGNWALDTRKELMPDVWITYYLIHQYLFLCAAKWALDTRKELIPHIHIYIIGLVY